MASSLLIGLKAILVSALGFGVAYPLSQVSSSTDKSTQEDTQKLQEETGPLESKKCEIFLTNVDGTYTVVSCSNSSNTKDWYLFNSKDKTLTNIQGLTSSNWPRATLNSSIDDWKEREWKGLKGWNTIRQQGDNPIEGPFKIAYKEGTFKFPFFKYFTSGTCVAVGTIITPDTKIRFICPSFDFPTYKFTDSLLIPEYKQAFKSNGESRCFAGRQNNWKVISCEQIKITPLNK
ncbi:hypothetical protein DNK47_03150 [Mycoplasma wenyonii]|uniref:Uncharacterized protein n=1 Tax=Mycoplasma wenyonii TaxID=65123 RepID=A0A328PNU3_9MOLU|nr:hypothetical protein [Mycoplasma wenyonii]RAO94786.1 hypothetical protein DNK47_03150 [Mycoplasma wenyonii]